MKAKVKNSLIYIGIVIFFFLFAACGNSKKSKRVEMRNPQDSAVIIEEESVVIQVDTLVPDSTGK